MIGLACFVLGFAASYGGTRLLLRVRLARTFVDVPNNRSSHESPKPRHGGIAIVGAFYAAFALLALSGADVRAFWPFAAGGAVLFVTGLFDDARGLSARTRLLVQAAAAVLLVATGNLIDVVGLPMAGDVSLGWLAVPVTVLFVIGSINFYNFIDGIDGLAAGSAFIASAFLSLIAWMLGHPTLAMLYLAMGASALGFLQFNFPPSRLFMGDGGSTFLGYFFACAAITGNGLEPSLPVLVPLLILSSLYLDAGLTVLKRAFRRERIFQPHRTHYYQRLLQIGLNHKQVTLLEYLVMILLGVSALLYITAGDWFAPFAGAVWAVVFTLAILKIRGLERGDRLFWERRTLFVVVTDLAAIVVAYLGAYFLRMGFRFTEAEGNAVLRALPIVVIVRSACFFKYGLYRSMWRYTTTSDVVRVIKAVTVGSAVILAAIVLLYRFVAFPRTLFVIEYFLLILFILGTRFSTRLFHEIGREARIAGARRYAVIGSGDAAERVAREVNARGPEHGVVCFVDDDPGTIGLTIHGVPVEGPGERLAEVCRRFSVDALVFGLPHADDAAASAWVERARAAAVPMEPAPGVPAAAIPPAIAMDRIATALGRRRTLAPRAAAALRGRTVLVTHGGGPMGRSIASVLRGAGAVPVLHVDDASNRERGAGDVAFCAGPLFEEAPAIVAAVMPDVILHVVAVESSGAINAGELEWHHLVRETECLARAAWRQRPGCRFVVASRWGRARAGDHEAAVAAVMEATLLCRAGTESAAVLRVTRVLTVERITAGAADARAAFDALEPEVACALVEIAAGAFRGIYAMAPGRELSLGTVLAAARGAASPPAGGSSGPLPVFPSEHLDECGIEGVRRVLSPLFPASGPFRHLAASGPTLATPAGREEWLRAVANQLYHVPSRGEAVLD